MNNSCFSIESGRGFANGVVARGNDVCIDVPFAREVLRIGLLVSEDSVEAERDYLLEGLRRYKMEM